MGLLLMILVSAVLGSFLTLLTQFLLLYRRQPEPPPDEAARAGDGFRYLKPVPGLPLREYLYGGGGGAEEPAGGAPEGGATPAPETPGPPTRETCYFLNATILFLFRELRDTALTRRWVTKKIKVEFEELLQTKTAGRLLEGLSLRDVFLGDTVPFIKTIRLVRPVVASATGEPDGAEPDALPPSCPEELAFEAEVEYNGGFHLAIDVDLVFGKSAYLFVKLSRVVGRLRFVLTRVPFTHWFFSFVEDPLIDFEVRSQFEGRPMPQLTSIIVNQLKKVIKRKHTLPNYKIRFKPFFPYQTLQGFEKDEEHIHVQQWALTEGRLKVTLLECSRLFIFGSYDREANIHCTLELSSSVWEEKQRSSIKTVELIKGNLQSVGLTLRLVQSTDGYAGHVIIETVAPNSPAAIADLQRGDRLIAIGGVKITSTLQVLKLIKQAGDRVLVYYERPVGQSNPGAVLQDSFGQLEENFLSGTCQPSYEDEATGLAVEAENRDLESEFEDLASDVRTQNESKDEAQALSHSPKRTPTTLSIKPLGAISPVLNRKLVTGSHQVPPKIPPKEGNKPSTLKTSEVTDPAQMSKPAQGSTSKPPVPPRPQLKVALPSADAPNQAEPDVVEKPEKALAAPPDTDKSTEKQAKTVDHGEDITVPKPPVAKQEVAKDFTTETSCPNKDNTDDPQTWESSEILYRNKLGKWTRTRASCLFDIEACHKYLNIALWCRDPFKLGGLICLGHISLKLEEVALGCLATSNMEYLSKFRLEAPSPKAVVTRTALRNLSVQKGFNDKFCFGDITIHFKYLKEGEPDHQIIPNIEKEKELNLVEEGSALPKEEHLAGQLSFAENKHNFQDTQFQNPTWCDYCKKKVWTKAASQCMFCAYVCHKKCQEKCLAETPLCGATDRRIDRTLKNLRLDGQEPLVSLPRADAEANKSVNRTTGLTRHIINTSSRLLNLRQVSKTRLSEPGTDLAEPSPKHTPNTSDNEGSDTEVCGPNSPSKRGNSAGIKLVRKEGGLDDSVFIAVKEIGRDLYRGLPTEERVQKLEFMLDKLQNEIDQELEHNNSLVREEKDTTDTRKKSLLSAALAKSGERLQALTLLMIHYRAGIEDIETLESLSLDQHSKKVSKFTDDAEEDLNNEISQLIDTQPFSSISDDLFSPSESV
ncbi:PDZ domain-containing protein 8 [Ochotona princeps]|uniref:PDZ domain-containing protein 8 n=1 Tax=Ochotona princeps TaxID=9978 RepID=UPI002714ACA6|nr:PDZ domain-containing protein 8 [Ochotona princeps]